MRRLRIAFLTVALLFAVIPVRAQDKTDILRWLPAGDYEAVAYDDISTVRMRYTARLRLAYVKNPLAELALTPVRFDSPYSIAAIASARLATVRVSSRPAFGAAPPIENADAAMMSCVIGDAIYYGESKIEHLFAVRLLSTPSQREMIESGGVVEARLSIGSSPVYSFSTDDPNVPVKRVYALLTDSGELLMAETLETLRRMAAAGDGRAASVLDNPPYRSLGEDVRPGALSVAWSIKGFAMRAVLRRAEEDGAPAEVLQQVRTRNEQAGGLLERLVIWDIPRWPRRTEIQIFSSEAVAQERYKKWSTAIARDGDRLTQTILDARDYAVDGDRLIITIIYDAPLINRLAALSAEKIRQEKDDR